MYSNHQVGGWYLLVRYPLFCVSQPSLFVDETFSTLEVYDFFLAKYRFSLQDGAPPATT